MCQRMFAHAFKIKKSFDRIESSKMFINYFIGNNHRTDTRATLTYIQIWAIYKCSGREVASLKIKRVDYKITI